MKSPTCNSHPKLGLVIISALALATSMTTRAQTNFLEDFESGNLNNWTVYLTQPPLDIATPNNQVPPGGIYSARMTNGACRMYNTSLPDVIGYGITAQSFKFSFYYYDNSGTAARAYNEVRNYPGGTFGGSSGFGQLLAIGKYNSVTMAGETYKGTKYQGRMGNGTPNGWFNLDAPGSPNRSTGWHRFEIERGVNTLGEVILGFYVDGILSRIFTNSNANAAWDTIILGPGVGTTAGDAWFDGLQIIQGQAYITGDPASQAVTVGDNAYFEVSAIGDADLPTYQWRKNGTNLVGSTDYYYSITGCGFGDAGNYTVVVSNIFSVKTSHVAVLTVNPLNQITVPPTNQFVNVGSNVQFYAEATGSGTLYYQWKWYGTNIPGATGIGASSTYDIPVAAVYHAGPYSVTVTNDLGNPPTTSADALLQVNDAPVINAVNVTNVLGKALDLVVSVTEDYSPLTAPFQTFETNALGRHTMFAYPSGSGTTDPFVDNPGLSAVTNSFPASHASPRVLAVAWNWTNTPGWLRLTTASSSGAQDMINPIIYVTSPLRFDMWCSKDLLVAIGVRETSPTGPIGADAGASSLPIEFVGVSAGGSPPAPTTTVTASNWTTVEINMPSAGVASFNLGNAVLDSTTGKGTLEHLALVPADGNPGEYLMYLDNFVSVPSNALTFELVPGPAGATIDPWTGRILWTPTATGDYDFTVKVTDAWTLSDTKSFTVKVVDAAVPGFITIAAGPGNVTLHWTNSFQLQSNSVNLADPTKWHDVPGVLTSPYNTPAGANPVFFRLRK